MRAAAALGITLLLAAGAAAALHFSVGGDEPVPLVANTKAAFREVADARLEKTADYWLGAAKNREAGDIRGSGAALAIAIKLGRLEALRTGADPLSDRSKRLFRSHYPEKVLDKARWTVAEPGSRLGRVLARWPVQEGAVTLGEVIVFKTRSAAGNRRLLAHELVHVDQYRNLGIRGFARRYAANPDPLEEEARSKAKKVVPRL